MSTVIHPHTQKKEKIIKRANILILCFTPMTNPINSSQATSTASCHLLPPSTGHPISPSIVATPAHTYTNKHPVLSRSNEVKSSLHLGSFLSFYNCSSYDLHFYVQYKCYHVICIVLEMLEMMRIELRHDQMGGNQESMHLSFFMLLL